MTLAVKPLAQIVPGSPDAVRVLERHGIDYCAWAEHSLGDVCRDLHLDVEALVAEMRGASDPDDRDWSSAPLSDLMDYLVDVDHTFIRAELPLLERRLALVVERYAPEHPSLSRLPLVFSNLSRELEAHMQGEERDLFPAIARYEAAVEAGTPLPGSPLAAFGGPLHLMEQEHESAGAALRLLREFCRNYNVPREACLRYRALIDGLAALEDRLARHVYLENTVLYPRAAALKSTRRWASSRV